MRHSSLSQATSDIAYWGRGILLGPNKQGPITPSEMARLLASTSPQKRVAVVFSNGVERMYAWNRPGGIREGLDSGAFYIRGRYLCITADNRRAFFEWLKDKKATSLRKKGSDYGRLC